MLTHLLRLLLAGVLALGSSGCSGSGGDEPAEPDPGRVTVAPPVGGADHTHAPGQGHSTVEGDGTRPTAGGYSLSDLTLPAQAGEPGGLSFRILDPRGEPVTDYVEEQTKLLHLYVVRADLQGFRHVHPTLSPDGTWSARVNLPEPGSYRVIAEFTPDASDGQRYLLGGAGLLDGRWAPVGVEEEPTADDGMVAVALDPELEAGPDQQMSVVVSTPGGEPLSLESYLGAAAHVTGIHVDTGAVVHVHPFGEPEIRTDGTRLTMHTEFEQAGRYRFFVQVRVGGFLHTVPVTSTVV